MFALQITRSQILNRNRQQSKNTCFRLFNMFASYHESQLGMCADPTALNRPLLCLHRCMLSSFSTTVGTDVGPSLIGHVKNSITWCSVDCLVLLLFHSVGEKRTVI